MKRTILALLALQLVAWGAWAESVPQDKAEQTARQFMTAQGRAVKRLALRQSPQPAGARSQSDAGDRPTYYLFSNEGDKGFVIVSGDDVARPILGYSPDAQPLGDELLPPAMQEWLATIDHQISLARKQGLKQTAEVAQMWKAPTTGTVQVYMQTAQWDQGTPYNNECPIDGDAHSLTGCAATAYAITMRYYQYPSSGRGVTPEYYTSTKGIKVPSRDLNHEYDWERMPLILSNGYSKRQGDAVAQLLADVGAAIQVDYTKDNTNGSIGGSQIFTYFGMATGTLKGRADYDTQEWDKMLAAQLDQEQPVIYRGAYPNDDNMGHLFVICGYTDQNYYYVNWGWGGNCNGLYSLDALTPNNTDFNFTGGQHALFGCVPVSLLGVKAIVNDEIECPSLADALSMAPTDSTETRIKLTSDSEGTYTRIEPGQNVVVDLNGHTLTMPGQTIVNYGTLTMTDTGQDGKICMESGNVEIFSNLGKLIIEDGTYVNAAQVPENQDYRRCIWSDANTETVIKGGTFTAPCQTLCFNGKATISGGEFETTGNTAIVSNYCVKDTLTISGGTFTNNGKKYDDEPNDYRRAIWTVTQSFTRISGGTFTSPNQTVCLCGKGDISGGTFNSTSSDGMALLCVYFDNPVTISGGTFTANTTNITLCNSGKTVINGGTIINNGQGCSVWNNSNLTINGGFFKGGDTQDVGTTTGRTTICKGGFYAHRVQNSYLPSSDYQCIANDDAATKATFPFRVVSLSAVTAPTAPATTTQFFSLGGARLPHQQPGLNIMRMNNGKTVKVIK